VLGGI
jgi:hypothetical protein